MLGPPQHAPQYSGPPPLFVPYAMSAPGSHVGARPPSVRPLPNPGVTRRQSSRSAHAPRSVVRATSYSKRQRSTNNYPGITYGDPSQMLRRRSRSDPYPAFGPDAAVAPRRTTVYDAYPNSVKFKGKGESQNGVTLQDAMLGVELSRSKRYLMNDLHLDSNLHLTCKVSVSRVHTVLGVYVLTDGSGLVTNL
jgi:hypothetical protein